MRLVRYAGPPWRPFESIAPSRRQLTAFYTLMVPSAVSFGPALYTMWVWAHGFTASMTQ